MPSVVEDEIHERLRLYLAGDIALDDFTDWFIPVMWEIQEGEDLILKDLVGTIDLYLIESGMGHRSEAELKAALTPLVPLRPRPKGQSRNTVESFRMTIDPHIRTVTSAIRGQASSSQAPVRRPHAGVFV